jgi:hypothetical protein
MDPDPVSDPDPSITKQKQQEKPLFIPTACDFFLTFYL